MHQIEHLPDILQDYPGTIDLSSLQKLACKEVTFPRLSVPKQVSLDLDSPVVTIGRTDEWEGDELEKAARELIPWKKGPFSLFGRFIDAEWRSDLKWERIAPFLGDLCGKYVLDVGCNNGYFMFRLAGAKAKEILGIDPSLRCARQFHFLQHFAWVPNIRFAPWGIEQLKYFRDVFDVVLYLGIIYHHRNPIEQLVELRRILRPGGRILVETIGIPGEEALSLTPKERYANMKNVYFVPTLCALTHWAYKAKFREVTPIFSVRASSAEQRTTKWCPPGYPSFKDFLDPRDASKTIEGYPAPLRMALLLRI